MENSREKESFDHEKCKRTNHLTVVGAVTTRQEAWVENHIHSVG